MAKYKYKVWDIKQRYSWSVSRNLVKSNERVTYCISGKSNYTITPSGVHYTETIGTISLSGNAEEYCPTSNSHSQRVYQQPFNDRVREYFIKSYEGTVAMIVDIADLVLQKSYGSPEKGDNFIKEVIAEDGTYPTQGVSGGYWYERGELANNSPTITVGDTTQQILKDKGVLTIAGSVKDTNTGDILTVKAKVGTATLTLATITANGENQNFSKSFVVADNVVKNGTQTVVTMEQGTNYNADVWVEDDKGNKSSILQLPFRAYNPPLYTLTSPLDGDTAPMYFRFTFEYDPIMAADTKRLWIMLSSNPDLSNYSANTNLSAIPNDTGVRVIIPGTLYFGEQSEYKYFQYKTDNSDWSDIIKVRITKSPTLTLNAPTDPILHEKETLTFSGQATDLDVGDTVMVKYRINYSTTKTIKAEVSQGVAINYQKSLVFKGGQLYDGATSVSSTLREGVTHTVEVWAEDEHGGKSTVGKVPFTVVPNRPPVLAITTIPTLDKQLLVDIAKIEGTAIDPDENTMTLQVQINTQVAKTIPIKDGAWSFSFALKELKEGTNYITFTLADQYDAIHRKQVRLTLQPSHTPTAHKAVRMAVEAPEPVDTIIMWIKRGPNDKDLAVDVAITSGESPEIYAPMEKRETISNITGSLVNEDEFYYHSTVPGAVVLKMANTTGMRIMTGATSNENKTI